MALAESSATVISMMQTCRILASHGAGIMLARGVWLKDEDSIVSFLGFLLAIDDHHIDHFRDLTLVAPPVLSTSTSHSLASMIELSAAISALVLEGEWEEILEAFPHVRDALSSLSSVKTVRIPFAGKNSLEIIHKMHSPLSFAFLGHLPQETDSLSSNDGSIIHPLTVLQNSRDTLETLVLDWCIGDEPAHPPPQFPLLRELQMADLWDPIIGPYISASPNLKTLSASTADDQCEEEEINHPAVIARVSLRRSENTATQARHGSWSSLDLFTGTAVGLYILGLKCKIKSLDLTIAYEPFLWLSAVLADTHPSTLRLSIRSVGSAALADGHLPHVLRQSSASSVRDLTVKLQLTKRDHEADLSSLLVRPHTLTQRSRNLRPTPGSSITGNESSQPSLFAYPVARSIRQTAP